MDNGRQTALEAVGPLLIIGGGAILLSCLVVWLLKDVVAPTYRGRQQRKLVANQGQPDERSLA